MRWRLLFVPVLALTLAACKDELVKPPAGIEPGFDPSPGSGGGGGGGSGTNNDGGTVRQDAGGDGGGVCSDLAYGGPLTDEEAVADDAPPGEGGVIGNGTYNLTNVRRFVGTSLPGPTGDSYRATLVIADGTFERASTLAASGASQETRTAGVYTANGTTLTLSTTCPSSAQETFTYTATVTTLILTNIATKRATTYTLGP